jgi:hypothetical protein
MPGSLAQAMTSPRRASTTTGETVTGETVTGAAEARHSSVVRALALIAVYVLTMASSLVVHFAPNGDPIWALVIAATGSLVLASGSLAELVRALAGGQSIAEAAEATTGGMVTAAVGCGVLLSLGVRGHHPPQMFACLAAGLLIGYGPVLLSRQGLKAEARRERGND